MKPFQAQTFYELLEISVAASEAEIRGAFERLTHLYSDDQVALYGLIDAPRARALRTRLKEAFDTLSRDERRDEYDRRIGLPPREGAPVPVPKAQPPRPPLPSEGGVSSAGSWGGQYAFVTSAPASSVKSSSGLTWSVPLAASAPVVSGRTESELERREADVREAQRRLELERAEVERRDAERRELERVDAERREVERREAERAETERREAELREAERRMAERLEAERLDNERRDAERRVAERLELERHEAERRVAERLEAERVEAEKREIERREAEVREAERRLETESIEAERRELERREGEIREAERRMAERIEADRAEAERREVERREAEARDAEQQLGPPPPSAPTAESTTGTAPSVTAVDTGEALALAPPTSSELDNSAVDAEPPAKLADVEVSLAIVRANPTREYRAPEPKPKPTPYEMPAGVEVNGDLIRQVRMARGLSLIQLSERTRISVRHLENVESDKYDQLPAAVYLRGILMNLARELGIDGLRVAKSYLSFVDAHRSKAKD